MESIISHTERATNLQEAWPLHKMFYNKICSNRRAGMYLVIQKLLKHDKIKKLVNENYKA